MRGWRNHDSAQMPFPMLLISSTLIPTIWPRGELHARRSAIAPATCNRE